MSNWFKNIPCPNCKRVLRYSPNTTLTTLTCFACKAQFVPSELSGLEQPPNLGAATNIDASKKKKLPRWAKTPPKMHVFDSMGSTRSSHKSGNAKNSWANADAQPFESSIELTKRTLPIASHHGGGRRKFVIIGGSAVALFIFAAIGWMIWRGVKVSDSTLPDPAIAEQTEPPATTEPVSGFVATILKHAPEIFAIEEYVMASLSVVNEQYRASHMVFEIKDLQLTDKVRFSMECKKYPNLLNADKHTLNPKKRESGEIEKEFRVSLPWNLKELTSPSNRDPMIEIRIEAFVNEQSAMNQTLRFHFNEIYVLPLDSFVYAAAFVQPDHPQIKSLQGQYASMDLKWDWDGLEKSMADYVRNEVSAQTKEPAKAKELSDEKCAELEKSNRSILRTYFVWKLVDALQIKYQNLPKNDTPGLRSCQQLRTVSEVLKSKMGNCIEESILLTSLMQEGASLMSPPGHCMVMVGSEFDFVDSIPLECTKLGASVDLMQYQSILNDAKDVHVQSGLGRLLSALQVMPPKMKNELESDPSWRNFTSAIEAGSKQLELVFDRCTFLRAWTQSTGGKIPFPAAFLTNNLTQASKEQLYLDWKTQEQEMLTWLKTNDPNYALSEVAKSSQDPILRGLANWHTVCLLKNTGQFTLDNYVPISYARKIGIVALPNDSGSTSPNQ